MTTPTSGSVSTPDSCGRSLWTWAPDTPSPLAGTHPKPSSASIPITSCNWRPRRSTRSAAPYWNELRALSDQDAAKRFKDSRWSLLKAPKNLTDKQAATLKRLKSAGGEAWRGYTLKEAARGIFEHGLTLKDVELLIDRLLSRLSRSRLEPFIRLGKTIRKHRDGILAAIRLQINQGRTEALNNKVRLITRRAYGFHSAKAALALVMLTCGPITLQLPHELHSP
jgi:transposase